MRVPSRVRRATSQASAASVAAVRRPVATAKAGARAASSSSQRSTPTGMNVAPRSASKPRLKMGWSNVLRSTSWQALLFGAPIKPLSSMGSSSVVPASRSARWPRCVGAAALPARLAFDFLNALVFLVAYLAFNLAFTLDSPFSVPDKRHGDELFLELLPGTNYVRLVMLHWYDRPTLIGPKGTAVSAGNDCSLGHVRWGEPVISPRCLEQMDTILRWSASQGLWAIVTARCSLAAGEQIPNKYSTNVLSLIHI